MWHFLKKYPYLILLGIAFAIFSLSLIVSSGWWCKDGVCQLYLAEWQMHDSLWHIALSKLAFVAYPLHNPFYAGSTLSGYNYGIDLVLYCLSLIRLDPFVSYFWIMPVLIVIFYLYVSYQYLARVTTSNIERYVAAAFLFLCTSLSYIVSLYATDSLIGSTLRGFPVVTSLHPPSMFLNLPYALSLPLILILVISLFTNKPLCNITLFLWALASFGLKFYAGFAGLLLILFFSKRQGIIKPLTYFCLGTLTAYLLFYYRADAKNFPFVFAPLSIPHVIIDDIHLFYNHQLTLARYYLYENLSFLPLRLIGIEGLTILLFIMLNWGTRAISYLLVFFVPKDPRVNKLLMISLILGVIPILGVQSGGWYNTMQFMYYSVFLLSLATARLLANLFVIHRKSALILSLIIVLPLLPTTLEQLSYPFKEHNTISPDETEALNTLRSSPKGIVHVNRPWAKRALIPALAEQEMYYLDTDQLMLFLPSYQERLDMVQKYGGGSISQIPADYYYIVKEEVGSDDSYVSLKKNLKLKLIHESSTIAVFGRSDLMIQ